MKIWVAIIYGIFCGLTELLPLSFQGHAVFLQGAFRLPALTGEGYFVRAALCLGCAFAVLLSLPSEFTTMTGELLKMTGLKKQRRKEKTNAVLRRSILLAVFALLPMLCALFYLSFAEKITSLLYTAGFFALNGLLLCLCFRIVSGKKSEREATVLQTFAVGIVRGLSAFPGLSCVGSSLCVGNAFGFSAQYNSRLTYLLTLFYEAAKFVYYLICGFSSAGFSAALLLPMLFGALASAVAGYFAIQYLRYLLRREKLGSLSFYCWSMTGIMLFLSLINA